MWDLVITGGTVVDGSGRPGVQADVAVTGDRITAVGDCSRGQAVRRLDARGLVVAPGFIDMHSHSDLAVFGEPALEPKLQQGITLELLGQDGLGVALVPPEGQAAWADLLEGLDGRAPEPWPWSRFGEYRAALAAVRPGPNLAALVTYGAVRYSVMGMQPGRPGAEEQAAMQRLVAEAMAEGAKGLSLGLIYQPCVYAEPDELVALYRVVAASGGILVVHLRNEADFLPDAIDEVAAIGLETGVPVHLSHLKIAGRRNWGRAEEVLERLQRWRERGVDLTFDQYPYTAGSTYLHAILPPWASQGTADAIAARLGDPAVREAVKEAIRTGAGSGAVGAGWDNLAGLAGWENIRITYVGHPERRWMEGLSVAEIGERLGRAPDDAALDLIRDERGAVGMVDFVMDEATIRTFLTAEGGMLSTDGLMGGRPHPRAYGTFPRVLGRYVREQRVLTLEAAVARMAAAPARRLGLRDRGRIAPGLAADLVVFDPATIRDRATYAEPRQFPEGIRAVVVNGRVAVEEGRPGESRHGRAL
ncbi:N-acyl-D-glutamate deacylase [Candidatus Hydrogenisulfobacillus filiaventi]|uniref:N-acyl-D-glutamate deacylase n=1 Tax=Candidatus Hydrogenisulfobacillus filiaventi TaxID=2707344 RepID=A0A6F8ZDV6_9FIRM|nr:N-acyl-D-glutamate deacylase [Candidatus Hydrogenisulfobacillus filiaventi]